MTDDDIFSFTPPDSEVIARGTFPYDSTTVNICIQRTADGECHVLIGRPGVATGFTPVDNDAIFANAHQARAFVEARVHVTWSVAPPGMRHPPPEGDIPRCSFCGSNEGSRVVDTRNHEACICMHCVRLCLQILAGEYVNQDRPLGMVTEPETDLSVARIREFLVRAIPSISPFAADRDAAAAFLLLNSAIPLLPDVEGKGGSRFACSFCGCLQRNARAMVAGASVTICEGCVAMAVGAFIPARPSPPPHDDQGTP